MDLVVKLSIGLTTSINKEQTGDYNLHLLLQNLDLDCIVFEIKSFVSA